MESLQPVLIVGAGPTGLVLALWLAKAGIKFRIIDKTGAPGTTSRALVLHARNLEFYRQLGIDEITLKQGIEAKALNLWLRGKPVGRLPFGDLGVTISRYPYALIFPQDAHEQMLIGQLESWGIQVERDTELLDLQYSGAGASAEIRTPRGRESVQYQYVAGCDGAHSTVREKIGIGFPGGTYEHTFYVADIAGNGAVLNGEINGALDDADFLLVFPMKGEGRARLVGAIREENEQREIRWEDVSQKIIRDLNLRVDEVNWLSSYRVHHRVASHFQKRGVFLLGDAAHIHSPVGGQGMNTGIGDAVNLAWKLAAVLKKASPEPLLETYEPERIAFARRLVATTDRAFAAVSARGRITAGIRIRIAPRLLPFLFGFAVVRRFMFRTVSQTAIKYPRSPLSEGPLGTVVGGQRLPWVQFEHGPGSGPDNYESLGTMDWQVHRYGDAAPALQEMCERRSIKFDVFPWNPAAEQAGLRKNAAYIIRPDGHVGIVDLDADPDRISAYLDGWLTDVRPALF